MHIAEMQAEIDRWIRDNGGYWDELALTARLAEEVGEVARAVLHHHGPKKPKPGEPPGDPAEELADVLWITACLANRLGVDLEAAFAGVMHKVRTRDAGRHGPPPAR